MGRAEPPPLPMEHEHDCYMKERVEALEKKMDRASDTHKEFYNRIRELEKADAVRDEQYATIIEKLDSLTETVTEITDKPGKRWDAVTSNVIFAVVGAVVAYILATIGL